MNYEKLTLRQYMQLSILCLVGGTVLENISTQVGYRAWLLYLTAFSFALFTFLMLYRLLFLHDFRSIPQITESCLGKWAGKSITLLYGFFFLFRAKIVGDGLTKMATEALMRSAPNRLVMFVLLFAAVYAVHKGLGIMGKSAEIMFPILVICLIPFFLAPLFIGKVHIPDLRVSLAATSWSDFFKKTMTVMIYPYTETLLFFLFIVKVQRNERNKYFNHLIVSSSIATTLLILITMGTVILLGEYATYHLRYPFYNAMQLVQLPGVIDRFDAMAAIVIIISIFYKASLYLYGWTDMAILVFPKLTRNQVLAATAALIIIQGPSDTLTNSKFLAELLPFEILPIFHMGIPAMLWMITEIKHKKLTLQQEAVRGAR